MYLPSLPFSIAIPIIMLNSEIVEQDIVQTIHFHSASHCIIDHCSYSSIFQRIWFFRHDDNKYCLDSENYFSQ